MYCLVSTLSQEIKVVRELTSTWRIIFLTWLIQLCLHSTKLINSQHIETGKDLEVYHLFQDWRLKNANHSSQSGQDHKLQIGWNPYQTSQSRQQN